MKNNIFIFFLIWFLFKCSLIGAIPFSLNNNFSHINWSFNNSYFTGCSNLSTGSHEWGVICGTECNAHQNGDYYAEDWIRVVGGNDVSLNESFKAPISGTIVFAGWVNSSSSCDTNSACSYGKQVVIRSNQHNSFAFRVTHLNRISVSVGQVVNVGDVIGAVGNTSCCSMNVYAHCALYKGIINSVNTPYLQAGFTPPATCQLQWCFDATNTLTAYCQDNNLTLTGSIASGVHNYYAQDYIYISNLNIPSNATCYFHCKRGLMGNGLLNISSRVNTFTDFCTIGQPVPKLKAKGIAPDFFNPKTERKLKVITNPTQSNLTVLCNEAMTHTLCTVQIYSSLGFKVLEKRHS